MIRARGSGLGTGTALGAAATVHVHAGLVVPPSPTPAIFERMARGDTELPDLVLFAPTCDAAMRASAALNWGTVAGIVAESPESPDSTPRVPAVIGVGTAAAGVAPDALVLIDADAGIVIVEPDLGSIARYRQQPIDEPRRRLYLGDEHEVARTTDGHRVEVYCPAGSAEEASTAVGAGADGICLDLAVHNEAMLAPVSEAAAGKPILVLNASSGHAEPLAQAAVSADVAAAVRTAAGDTSPLTELVAAIDAAIDVRFDREERVGAVRLAVLVDCATPPKDGDGYAYAVAGATRLVTEPGCAQAITVLAAWAGEATRALLPLICAIGSPAIASELGAVVGAGAAAIVTHDVADAKQFIANANRSALRDALLMSGGGTE